MKKIIFFLSFFIGILFMSYGQNQNTETYYFVNVNGEPNIVTSTISPKAVEFDNRLSNSENLEIITQNGIEVFKENISISYPFLFDGFKQIKIVKNFSAYFDGKKVIINDYLENKTKKISTTLIVLSIFFFLFFVFITIVQSEDERYDDGFQIFSGGGMIIILLSTVMSYFIDFILLFYVGGIFGGAFFLLSIPLAIISGIHDKIDINEKYRTPIFLILLILMSVAAYFIGENFNFLLYIIILPSLIGYLVG